MKKLILTLIFGLATLVPQALAVDSLPFFSSLRAEVLVQLDLATNGVASPDKKLVTALRKALTTIDKTKPTYATGAKAIGTLAKGLNRTAVSNEFVSAFESVVGIYIGALTSQEDALADRLAPTFPSKSRTAAFAALERLLDSLEAANNSESIILAAKFLATASKDLGTAAKLTVKAENAPAPASHFTATITGSSDGTANFRPSPAPAVASRIGNLLSITGQELKVNGTTVHIRDLQLNIPNLVDGTTTYNVSNTGSGNASVIYGWSISNPISGEAFGATSGSVTVTVNTTTKTAFGTFTFSAPEQDHPGTVATTSNGSFSVVWQ